MTIDQTAVARTASMAAQMASKDGFIAALDQSGGSTPGALKLYGIPETAYHGEAEMFRMMHEMRVRIMTSPAFTGARILGAILFEGTMDGSVGDVPVPTFLWERRGVVPFVKIDKGLEPEQNGVRRLKPMPGLETLLARAAKLGVYGTKMRSVIDHADPGGIAGLVQQQFEVAKIVIAHGLMPIVEPEVSIGSQTKREAETILLEEIKRQLEALPAGQQVMLKLTIPTETDLFLPLTRHPKVQRVVALSGGYSRDEACRLLAENHGMVASFSRALVENLRHGMSDDEFNAALAQDIEQIFQASVVKVA